VYIITIYTPLVQDTTAGLAPIGGISHKRRRRCVTVSSLLVICPKEMIGQFMKLLLIRSVTNPSQQRHQNEDLCEDQLRQDDNFGGGDFGLDRQRETEDPCKLPYLNFTKKFRTRLFELKLLFRCYHLIYLEP
jgi:hypothetical protein